MSNRVNETGQAEAVKTRTLDEVEAELSLAIDALHLLKAERDAVAKSIREATEAREPWRLGELEGRDESLRAQVEAARARLWLLQAERARRLLPEAEAHAEAARVAYERAHAEYLRAHTLTNRLGVEANNAKVRALGLRQTAEENERKARAVGGRLSR